jgi:hypothetical protein
MAGQIREVLDSLTAVGAFVDGLPRQVIASYFRSGSFLTAAIWRRLNSVTLMERHRSGRADGAIESGTRVKATRSSSQKPKWSRGGTIRNRASAARGGLKP